MNIQERDERLIRVFEDIENKEVLLQPDFQRGEVWSSSKKKLLVDTILRQWHIPPVHVVVMENGSYEVLDGQQRLTAIRDFVQNKFPIDGSIQPRDDTIESLHGMRYRDLSGQIKRDFDRYTLKINEIKDYNPGEPSELFHRLNQTVKLTSSEARNAIYGTMRNSISSLVDLMSEKSVGKEVLGFSNSRMAYNDLLSRVIVYLESGGLRTNLNESFLNTRYRDDKKIDEEIIESLEFSIEVLSFFNDEKKLYEFSPILTKASSLNWVYLFCTLYINDCNTKFKVLGNAFFALEVARAAVKANAKLPKWVIEHFGFSENVLRELLLVYIERSSSRVMSIGSILARDMLQNISMVRAGIDLAISSNDKVILESIINSLSNDEAKPKQTIEENVELWRANKS